MNWNTKDTVWAIALVATIAACVLWTRQVENSIRGQIKACEIAHFGGDWESVSGRLESLEKQRRTGESDAQHLIDCAITDLINPLSQQFKKDRDLRYEVLVDLSRNSATDEEREYNNLLIGKLFPDKRGGKNYAAPAPGYEGRWP